MIGIIFLLILAIPLLLYVRFLFSSERRAFNMMPGPPAYPLVGNGLQLAVSSHEILATLFKWWFAYDKDYFRLWVGPDKAIVLTNPKDLEIILSSTKLINKSPSYNFLEPWLGNGLLNAKDQYWRNHRKIITASFNLKILIDFLDVMNENGTKVIKKLHKLSQGDNIFDIQKEMCDYTLDVICETAMGVDINALKDSKIEIASVFHIICDTLYKRMFNPMIWSDFIFKLTPQYKIYSKALNTLKDFICDVIEKRRVLLDNDKKLQSTDVIDDNKELIGRKKVFLDTMLTATIDGVPLTTQEIYEETCTIMFGGFDTSASTLSFIFHILSRHAAVQEKIFEEQVGIFGNDFTRSPTYNDILEMKYLDLVIKETLRVYPTVPYIGRYTDTELNLNGKIIPKGTQLHMFLFAMGYNEEVFKDPYKFDPERFNKERENAHPYDYIPFSAGPRNCIGQKFANLELKSLVSKIVRAFQILPPEDGLYSLDGYESREKNGKYDLKLSAAITLKSDNGVYVRLRKRIPAS